MRHHIDTSIRTALHIHILIWIIIWVCSFLHQKYTYTYVLLMYSLSVIICFVWWNFASHTILHLLSHISFIAQSQLPSSSLHRLTPPLFSLPAWPSLLLLWCTSFLSFSLTAFVCCLRVWLCPPLRLSHSLSVSIPLCPFTLGRGALGASDSAPN